MISHTLQRIQKAMDRIVGHPEGGVISTGKAMTAEGKRR